MRMSMISPERAFIRVVLPALLEPITPTISPLATVIEKSLSARAFSKKTMRLVNFKHVVLPVLRKLIDSNLNC